MKHEQGRRPFFFDFILQSSIQINRRKIKINSAVIFHLLSFISYLVLRTEKERTGSLNFVSSQFVK